MLVLLTAGALIASGVVTKVLWDLTLAEPATRERPETHQLTLAPVTAWAIALAFWGAMFAVEANYGWWRTMATTGIAVLALLGVVGVRTSFFSVRDLYREGPRHAAREARTRAAQAAHSALSRTRSYASHDDPTLSHLDYRYDELKASLLQLEKAAGKQVQRTSPVRAEHGRREHTFSFYNNLLDSVRLWHNATIEWFALNATIVLRAALVASAVVLPRSLTVGVIPRGARIVAWLALTVWAAAFALAAPRVASVAMDLAPAPDATGDEPASRRLLAAMSGEVVLLAATLAVTPSWVILSSVSGVWNCANRLPGGFQWATKVPAVTAGAVAISLVSLMLHGASVGSAFLETAAGLVVAAAISNSFTVFLPATLFAMFAVPQRIWRARRRVLGALAPSRKEADAALDRLEEAAKHLESTWPVEADDAFVVTTVIRRQLTGSLPRPDDGIPDSLNRVIREGADQKRIGFDGVRLAGDLADARWRDPGHRSTALFMEAFAIIANEATEHGSGELVVDLVRSGDQLRVTATNGRREVSEATPRGGSRHIQLLVTELSGGTISSQPTGDAQANWTITFAVPLSELVTS